MFIIVDIGFMMFNKLTKFSAKFVSAPRSTDEGMRTQRSEETFLRVIFRGKMFM